MLKKSQIVFKEPEKTDEPKEQPSMFRFFKYRTSRAGSVKRESRPTSRKVSLERQDRSDLIADTIEIDYAKTVRNLKESDAWQAVAARIVMAQRKLLETNINVELRSQEMTISELKQMMKELD